MTKTKKISELVIKNFSDLKKELQKQVPKNNKGIKVINKVIKTFKQKGGVKNGN